MGRDHMKISTELLQELLEQDGSHALNTLVLEKLFDEVPDIAFFVKDTEGKYISVNSSLVARHGCSSREELIGRRPSDICPGPFGEVPANQDQKVLQSGRPLINQLELQWFRPNQPCWCLTTKLPLRDSKGNIIGLVGISKDLRDPVPVNDIPGEMALALDDFRKHCDESISPSRLAERARMPLSRFARLVKRVYGLTPSQFITQTRIQRASRLLLESDLTVAEIAIDCGFSDHSAFSRAFKNLIGLTPSEYREESGN